MRIPLLQGSLYANRNSYPDRKLGTNEKKEEEECFVSWTV